MKRKILIILSIFMAVVIVGCGDSGNSAGTNTGTGNGTGTGNNFNNSKCVDTEGNSSRPGTYGSVLSNCFSDMLTTTPASLLNKDTGYMVKTNPDNLRRSLIVYLNVSEEDQKNLKQSLVDYFGELTDMKAKYPDEPDFKDFEEVWQGEKNNKYVSYRIYTMYHIKAATITYEIGN